MARPRHDHASKLLFSRRELVADLIRGYVDPTAAAGMDLRTLERCNGTYIAPDLRERRNDLVWRARSRHGWIYVYLLIEFQSTVDRFMAVRLLAYVALLWQDLIDQGQVTGAGRLPPVLPIVLYNGDRPWSAPTELKELLAPAPSFLAQYQPNARHLFLDENRAATSHELGVRNVVAAVFALEQTADPKAHYRLIRQLRIWLRDRPDLKVAIGTWYAEAVAPTGLLARRPGATLSLDKVEPMMATRMKQWFDQRMEAIHAEAIAKGLAKGEAKGLAKGEAKGLAKGTAKGIALGRIRTFLDLVRSGALTPADARAAVRSLRKSRAMSRDEAKAVLARLSSGRRRLLPRLLS
jgi:predicted transposase YdaD